MTKYTLFPIVVGLTLVPAGFAGICPNGPYSLYLASNFTCTLGNLTFNGFGYSPSAVGTGVAIPASAVIVTTVTTPGDEGFSFGLGMNAANTGGSSSFQDSLLTFTVSAAQPAITGLQLSFNGSFAGTGLTGVIETYCFNHDPNSCPTGNRQLSVTNPPTNLNASSTFAAVQSISLSKDINATSGVNGTATLSQVINTFTNSPAPPSTTPLPPSLLLTLTGLGAAGLYMARRKFAQPS